MNPPKRSSDLSTIRAGDRLGHKLSLVVLAENFQKTLMLPDQGKLTIGRAESCDVVIDLPSVSRRHAILHLSPLRIEDLGSVNGTRVGPRQLAANETAPLPLRQTIELGEALLLVQPQHEDASHRPFIEGPSPERKTDLGDPKEATHVDLFIGQESMANLHRIVERVAKSEISVLLLGETGVGKEMFAQEIHRLSARHDNPFLGINCTALTANLLESELFGHEKGAFTGAVASKAGLLESANGGTVFLDEIGDLSPELQAKLLRAIAERKIRRVGSNAQISIDVRFIAATHRNLEEDIQTGAFRSDLFYRLSGVSLVIPPLRERREEIEPMAKLFLQRACQQQGRSFPKLSAQAIDKMRRYSWPGNVRELRNAMERAAVLSSGNEILGDDIPVSDAADQPNLNEELAQREHQLIADALEKCAGNQSKAAKLLGISRGVLIKRMTAYGFPRPRKDKKENK